MNYYKRLFSTKIWNRGDIYYRSGRVSDFVVLNGNYTFTVKGSDNYQVMLEIYNHKIGELYCDCPHALDGNYCKHMVAAVMKLDADGYIRSDGRIGKPKVAKNEWEKLVFEYTEKEGFTFKSNLEKLDRIFSQRLIVLQTSIAKSKSKVNLKKILKDLGDAHKALNYLDEFAKPKASFAAFNLVIQTAKDLDENTLAIWAIKQIKYAKIKEIFSILVSLAFTYDEAGLLALDEQIKSYDEGKNHIQIVLCLSVKIDIMEKLNYSKEQIIDALKDYNTFEFVKNYALAYYTSINDYNNMKLILQSFLKFPNLNFLEKQEIEDRIADIYVKTKDKDNYKKYVLKKVKEGNSFKNANYLGILKLLYDDKKEWKKDLRELAIVLKESMPYHQLIDLYNNTEEYGILFELLYSRYDLNALLQYKNELIKYNKSFFMHIVYQIMLDQLNYASNREDYYNIIDCLNDLVNDSECSVLVQDIIIYIKENCARKTLLMDMLDSIYEEYQGGLF